MRRAGRGAAAGVLGALGTLGTALLPAAALAHPGRAPAPHDLALAWSWEPGAVALLAGGALAYGAGVRRLWARAGPGRGVGRRHAALFAAGWAVLAFALVSPLHALGGALFSAHMAQHELLLALAAPLLVLGRPGAALAWAPPGRWRARVGRLTHAVARRARALAAPLAAAAVHGAAVWLWHAPPLYVLALRSEPAHAAQHACFLGTALLFWWAVLSPGARRRRPAVGALALFLTALHTGALGALVTVSGRVLMAPYLATTGPWGLTPLEDQQLAGLVMWIPGGASYLAAALWLLGTRLREHPGGERPLSASPRAGRAAAPGTPRADCRPTHVGA